jgi:hypothetical protein
MDVAFEAGGPGASVDGRVFSMIWYFTFFFLSGFCGILYELV